MCINYNIIEVILYYMIRSENIKLHLWTKSRSSSPKHNIPVKIRISKTHKNQKTKSPFCSKKRKSSLTWAAPIPNAASKVSFFHSAALVSTNEVLLTVPCIAWRFMGCNGAPLCDWDLHYMARMRNAFQIYDIRAFAHSALRAFAYLTAPYENASEIIIL